MSVDENDWMREISRLTALAERLADEGQMNLNKLVEAAIYARVRQAGWRYQPQVTKISMQAELGTAIRGLKEEGLSPDLLAALEAGLQALAEQRPGDLLYEEAPDVFVCRICGHVTLGSPPERCRECGSWPGRFRKFVAIFNGDNQQPIDPAEVFSLLAHNAEDLRRLVEGLSEEQLNRKPDGVDWSLRDHIAHFFDTQEMLDERVELMLQQENPELEALAAYAIVTEEQRHPPSTQVMIAEFDKRRRKCVARLEALPFKDLWRTGWHQEFGRITILRQAAYIAYHEQTHLPEIEALRKRVV